MVVLPAAKVTLVELKFNPLVLTVPLLVIVSAANSVSVVPTELAAIVASALIVKLPDTAIVTFALDKALVITVAVAASITISSGSSSQLPFLPIGAATFTVVLPRIFRVPTELVSIDPPLPPFTPPVALSVPAIVVCKLDQTLISPPLPLFVDEASTTAPACTVTVLAKPLATTLLWLPSALVVYVTPVVPMLIRPPLAPPFAEVVEPEASVMS